MIAHPYDVSAAPLGTHIFLSANANRSLQWTRIDANKVRAFLVGLDCCTVYSTFKEIVSGGSWEITFICSCAIIRKRTVQVQVNDSVFICNPTGSIAGAKVLKCRLIPVEIVCCELEKSTGPKKVGSLVVLQWHKRQELFLLYNWILLDVRC